MSVRMNRSGEMSLDSMPVGFRFRPTDEELINHYLKGKIHGRKEIREVIPEVDVCRFEPWDLPEKSVIKTGDQEWFFFSPKNRKYPNGRRSNRATEAGYWKATGKDREIKSKKVSKENLIGLKKTLVFHRGRAPKGEKTGWIMHEYRVADSSLENSSDRIIGDEATYVLCRLFKQSEEKIPTENLLNGESSGFSPSLDKSSPSVTQQKEESGEPYGEALAEKSLEKTVIEQNKGTENWLFHEVDSGMSLKPEEHSPSSNSLECDLSRTEIEFLLDALWQRDGAAMMETKVHDEPTVLDYDIDAEEFSDLNQELANSESEELTMFLDSIFRHDADEDKKDPWADIDGQISDFLCSPPQYPNCSINDLPKDTSSTQSPDVSNESINLSRCVDSSAEGTGIIIRQRRTKMFVPPPDRYQQGTAPRRIRLLKSELSTPGEGYADQEQDVEILGKKSGRRSRAITGIGGCYGFLRARFGLVGLGLMAVVPVLALVFASWRCSGG